MPLYLVQTKLHKHVGLRTMYKHFWILVFVKIEEFIDTKMGCLNCFNSNLRFSLVSTNLFQNVVLRM